MDNLIVCAYRNLTEAVDYLYEAQRTDNTEEQIRSAKERALQEISCLVAHFQGAIDSIPDTKG